MAAALMGVAGGELLIPTIVLLGEVPSVVLIPLLVVLMLASSVTIWRHEYVGSGFDRSNVCPRTGVL